MADRWDMRPASTRRRLERISIVAFATVCIAILIAYAAMPGTSVPAVQASLEVTAQANAMPNQGWAPLQVYLSVYGSRSTGAAIVRYEWDLDGNGQFDHDATAQRGYTSYIYSKPGTYTITLRVTDDLGRFATDQVTVSVRLPASSSVDYWTVFDDSRVGRIELALTQADWDALWVDPEAKVQVQADAVILGEHLEDIGLRMRGQFSLRESGAKKPWKIDTDAYVDGQEYHNLRQLLLLNNIGDPSMLKEKLAYEMMAFAGLPASHVAYVELWIDIIDDPAPPLYWGVYTLVERVDNKYLANRFGRDSVGGNLYKASHAQRGPMNLVYYGDRIEDYPTQNGQYAYGKMNNESAADYSDVIALCRVVDGSAYADEAAFIQAIEGTFNVDAFLRYMAVVNILDNWDSYPHTGNNYYLFNDPVNGKFQWLPWDLTWGGNAQAPLFGRAGGELVGRAPLYDRVFAVVRYRDRYAAYVDLLLRYWFNADNVSSLAQKVHRMIAPYVAQSTGDPAFFGDRAMFPYAAFQNSWQELVDFAGERDGYLRNALEQEQAAVVGIP